MSEPYETKRNNTMNEIREALECINTGQWRQLEGSVGRWANSWIENGVLVKDTKRAPFYFVDGYGRIQQQHRYKVDRETVDALLEDL